MSSPVSVIGHRGAPSQAPENTLVSFRKAIAIGVTEIELDVHLSKDLQLVVHHDETLDRTTTGTGLLSEYTWQEIRCLDAGVRFSSEFAGEKVPSLEEVLALKNQIRKFHIEIKSPHPELPQKLLDTLHTHQVYEQVRLTSFKRPILENVRQFDQHIPLGFLAIELNLTELIEWARKFGVDQICPKAADLTPEIVSTLHNAGFSVRAWGVKQDEALMRHALQCGVDGMTVDAPDRLIALLKEISSN
jgi:glycerophosphoryl diester phosphodiesterase